jgi:hypothetical protein
MRLMRSRLLGLRRLLRAALSDRGCRAGLGDRRGARRRRPLAGAGDWMNCCCVSCPSVSELECGTAPPGCASLLPVVGEDLMSTGDVLLHSELAKLQGLTGAGKSKWPSISDSLDSIIATLEAAKVAPSASTVKTLEQQKKCIDERQKEIYNSINRVGKALDKVRIPRRWTHPTLTSIAEVSESSTPFRRRYLWHRRVHRRVTTRYQHSLSEIW